MAHSLPVRLLRPLSLGLGILPPGCGQAAIARRLTPLRSRTPLIYQQRLVGGATVQLDLAERGQAVVYMTRRYEPDLVSVIAALLRVGGRFFDVGANIGLITFQVAARRPDVVVHAFEPDAISVERWNRNHALNQRARAVLEPAAVGASPGIVGIVRGAELGWTYVTQTESEDDLTSAPMITLDAYVNTNDIETIDLLKLDVEGYELFGLRGAERLLGERRIGAIVCEMNDFHLLRNGISRDHIVTFLGNHGYSPRLVPRTGARRFQRDATLATADEVLFVPS